MVLREGEPEGGRGKRRGREGGRGGKGRRGSRRKVALTGLTSLCRKPTLCIASIAFSICEHNRKVVLREGEPEGGRGEEEGGEGEREGEGVGGRCHSQV